MHYTKNSVCMYMYVLSRDAICRTGSQCVVHWKTDKQTVMKTTPPLPSAWITIPEAKLKIIWTRNLQQIIKIYCAFDEAVLATSLEGELSRLQGPRSHGVQGFIWPPLVRVRGPHAAFDPHFFVSYSDFDLPPAHLSLLSVAFGRRYRWVIIVTIDL